MLQSWQRMKLCKQNILPPAHLFRIFRLFVFVRQPLRRNYEQTRRRKYPIICSSRFPVLSSRTNYDSFLYLKNCSTVAHQIIQSEQINTKFHASLCRTTCAGSALIYKQNVQYQDHYKHIHFSNFEICCYIFEIIKLIKCKTTTDTMFFSTKSQNSLGDNCFGLIKKKLSSKQTV